MLGLRSSAGSDAWIAAKIAPRIEPRWPPVDAARRAGVRLPDRAVVGIVAVVGSDGAILEVKVQQPSGNRFLDEAAPAVVRQAAPFGAVPPALLGPSGQLSLELSLHYSRSGNFARDEYLDQLARTVQEGWRPGKACQVHDPRGAQLGPSPRITEVRARLTVDGVVDSAKVIQSCGLDFLDDEALDAMFRSSPLPVPPISPGDDGRVAIEVRFHYSLAGATVTAR